jgi:hypothetical protein
MRIIATGAAAMRHSAIAVAEAVLVAAIVAALLLALSPVYQPADFLAGTESAQAAKGGNAAKGGGTGGSLSLVMVEDTDGSGAPNHGETVTFDLSISADKPYVNVRCYQGTAFVYDGWVGYYDGAWFAQSFTLSSSYWASGAADCTARLVTWSKNGRERTHATMDFHVDV